VTGISGCRLSTELQARSKLFRQMRTDKSRPRRALMRLQDQMRRMRNLSLRRQAHCLNQMLCGHYAHYCIAGNIRALQRVHQAVERYWRKVLSSRSWEGQIWWEQFQRIKARFPLLRPKPVSRLRGVASYRPAVKQLLTSVVPETCTLRSVGAGEWATAPGHPVGDQRWSSPPATAMPWTPPRVRRNALPVRITPRI
jgi:hypothetical protein